MKSRIEIEKQLEEQFTQDGPAKRIEMDILLDIRDMLKHFYDKDLLEEITNERKEYRDKMYARILEKESEKENT